MKKFTNGEYKFGLPFTIYDFLGYVLPGFLFLLMFILVTDADKIGLYLTGQIHNLQESFAAVLLRLPISNIIIKVILIISVSYLVGFSISTIGSALIEKRFVKKTLGYPIAILLAWVGWVNEDNKNGIHKNMEKRLKTFIITFLVIYIIYGILLSTQLVAVPKNSKIRLLTSVVLLLILHVIIYCNTKLQKILKRCGIKFDKIISFILSISFAFLILIFFLNFRIASFPLKCLSYNKTYAFIIILSLYNIPLYIIVRAREYYFKPYFDRLDTNIIQKTEYILSSLINDKEFGKVDSESTFEELERRTNNVYWILLYYNFLHNPGIYDTATKFIALYGFSRTFAFGNLLLFAYLLLFRIIPLTIHRTIETNNSSIILYFLGTAYILVVLFLTFFWSYLRLFKRSAETLIIGTILKDKYN